jgi:hydrogenase-1 operon protein HyaF
MAGKMGLEDIAVVASSGGDQLTGNASAVLNEVATMLAALAEHDEPGIVDLGGLPMSNADKLWLSEKLGRGEIEISLDIGGPSQIRETAFHGVWWLVHHNEKGVLTGEYIEVSRVPELVSAHSDDIRRAAVNLGYLANDN